MKHNYAFMLVDVLVVIAIIGILAALIVPSYQQYVLASYRLEASAELLRLSALQANMHAEHGRFSNNLTELGFNESNGVTESGRYRLRIQLSDRGYQLFADAIGPQEQDIECLRFILEHTGVKGSQPSQHCWGY